MHGANSLRRWPKGPKRVQPRPLGLGADRMHGAYSLRRWPKGPKRVQPRPLGLGADIPHLRSPERAKQGAKYHMPQSLSNILVHLVFSTKQRVPWLSPTVRDDVFPYMTGVLQNLGCQVIQVGGVEDHIHLLFRLSRTVTIATLVERAKTSTTSLIKQRRPELSRFAWQAGYGAFSVGPGEFDTVIRYIQNQVVHHRKITFQEELKALLTEAGLEYDERYLWD